MRRLGRPGICFSLVLFVAVACGGAPDETTGFSETDDRPGGHTPEQDEAGAAGARAAAGASAGSGAAGGAVAGNGTGASAEGGPAGAGTGGLDQGEAAGTAGSVDEPPKPPPKKGAPYPIVLAHGFFGFEKFAGQEFITYFYKVKESLEKEGEFEVFTPAVDPFNSSEVRGAALAKAVEEIREKTGREKVNLIGHSQGGLDARVVAHDHPEWVASVVTVATPHRGSEVADVMLGVTADDRLADLLDDLVKVVGGALYGDVAGETSLSNSMQQLSTKSIGAFNDKYTDAPGIPYLSVTGRSSSALATKECVSATAPFFITKYAFQRDPIEPLLAVSALIAGHGTAIPNDGLVTVESAKWGEFLGCVPADHFDEIGHLFGDSPGLGNGFDYLSFYADLVGLIRERGY
jgi:triacylglycerol lipase